MFSTEELLLAARVRPVATRLQNRALEEAQEQWEREQLKAISRDPEYDTHAMKQMRVSFLKEWLTAHPLSEFCPPVVKDLEMIAEVIRNSRTR